jgi:hypothetical protein
MKLTTGKNGRLGADDVGLKDAPINLTLCQQKLAMSTADVNQLC